MVMEPAEVGARTRFWGQSRHMEKAGERGQPTSQDSAGPWLCSLPLSVR